MEKLLIVQNYWGGEVNYPNVMGRCCPISEEEVAAAIKGLKIGKAAGPTGVVCDMMKASGDFDTTWMTDLITALSKMAVFLMIGERVSWCLYTKGKVIHLCVVHIVLLCYWSIR